MAIKFQAFHIAIIKTVFFICFATTIALTTNPFDDESSSDTFPKKDLQKNNTSRYREDWLRILDESAATGSSASIYATPNDQITPRKGKEKTFESASTSDFGDSDRNCEHSTRNRHAATPFEIDVSVGVKSEPSVGNNKSINSTNVPGDEAFVNTNSQRLKSSRVVVKRVNTTGMEMKIVDKNDAISRTDYEFVKKNENLLSNKDLRIAAENKKLLKKYAQFLDENVTSVSKDAKVFKGNGTIAVQMANKSEENIRDERRTLGKFSGIIEKKSALDKKEELILQNYPQYFGKNTFEIKDTRASNYGPPPAKNNLKNSNFYGKRNGIVSGKLVSNSKTTFPWKEVSNNVSAATPRKCTECEPIVIDPLSLYVSSSDYRGPIIGMEAHARYYTLCFEREMVENLYTKDKEDLLFFLGGGNFVDIKKRRYPLGECNPLLKNHLTHRHSDETYYTRECVRDSALEVIPLMYPQYHFPSGINPTDIRAEFAGDLNIMLPFSHKKYHVRRDSVREVIVAQQDAIKCTYRAVKVVNKITKKLENLDTTLYMSDDKDGMVFYFRPYEKDRTKFLPTFYGRKSEKKNSFKTLFKSRQSYYDDKLRKLRREEDEYMERNRSDHYSNLKMLENIPSNGVNSNLDDRECAKNDKRPPTTPSNNCEIANNNGIRNDIPSRTKRTHVHQTSHRDNSRRISLTNEQLMQKFGDDILPDNVTEEYAAKFIQEMEGSQNLSRSQAAKEHRFFS